MEILIEISFTFIYILVLFFINFQLLLKYMVNKIIMNSIDDNNMGITKKKKGKTPKIDVAITFSKVRAFRFCKKKIIRKYNLVTTKL